MYVYVYIYGHIAEWLGRSLSGMRPRFKSQPGRFGFLVLSDWIGIDPSVMHLLKVPEIWITG